MFLQVLANFNLCNKLVCTVYCLISSSFIYFDDFDPTEFSITFDQSDHNVFIGFFAFVFVLLQTFKDVFSRLGDLN